MRLANQIEHLDYLSEGLNLAGSSRAEHENMRADICFYFLEQSGVADGWAGSIC